MSKPSPDDDQTTTGSEQAWSRFQEKLKKTVFLDNISPSLTEEVIVSGLSQWGTVVSTTKVMHDLDPKRPIGAALVEMASVDEAKNVLEECYEQKLFMLGGMPKPIRVVMAKEEHFPDRPQPKRRVKTSFVPLNTPEGKVAKKKRDLAWRHLLQLQELEKEQLKEAKELAGTQEKEADEHYQTLEWLKRYNGDSGANALREWYSTESEGLYS